MLQNHLTLIYMSIYLSYIITLQTDTSVSYSYSPPMTHLFHCCTVLIACSSVLFPHDKVHIYFFYKTFSVISEKILGLHDIHELTCTYYMLLFAYDFVCRGYRVFHILGSLKDVFGYIGMFFKGLMITNSNPYI